jgi:hypothetical protein
MHQEERQRNYNEYSYGSDTEPLQDISFHLVYTSHMRHYASKEKPRAEITARLNYINH